MRRPTSMRSFCIMAFLVVLLIASCQPAPSRRGVLTVASSDAPEQVLLGKMLVLTLRDAGFEVDDRTALGDPWIVRAALEAGSVDMCWQYTGEAWSDYLGHDLPVSDPEEAFHQVRDADALNQITWLAMAPYERKLALLMMRDRANQLGIETLSDLAYYMKTINPEMRICTPEGVSSGAQGLGALARVYKLEFRPSSVRLVPFEQGYEALLRGECDCAVGRLVDADLHIAASGQFAALADDRGFFQASNLALVVRTAVLQEHADVEPRVTEISGLLTHQTMIALSRQASKKGANLETLARRFLKENGILRRWELFPMPTPTPKWLTKDKEDDS